MNEIKTNTEHYFLDDQGLRHGEYKKWASILVTEGMFTYLSICIPLQQHCFYDQGKIIVDFTKNPELYPTTEADRLMFTLKYNGSLIG